MKLDTLNSPGAVGSEQRTGREAGDAAGAPLGRRNLDRIDPAAILDVLCEQVRYLVSHVQERCPRGCPQCARLDRVKAQLLVPFL